MSLLSRWTGQSGNKRRVAEDRRIVWLRRAGIGGGVLILIFWLGAWFFLTDLDTRTYNWIHQKTLIATANMGYRVEDILVEGRVNADRAALLTLLDVKRGDSIFKLDPRKARESLEATEWIRSARIERRLPGTLFVRLEERHPLALWKTDDGLKLVDETGAVMTVRDIRPFKALPMVSGEGAPAHAPELLGILEAEPDVIARFDSAHRIEDRRWNLLLKNGIGIKLPENDPGLALRTLALSHEKEQIMDWDIDSIDLRDPGRIVFRTKLGKVQEYKTGLGSAQAL